ncbi:IscS subfamily cysteine desulfurase [Fictibacillus terranigra]|uniref:IscS subfamily cysteine desulfurase n=1 Tax=Fictibacillus terranigra TaxID=3058424 RepID=A0ABT8E4C6_9BACL|nr:IscS subfamily cysteine desulfurase [Fictibacillus sp. CENA-BCM004]MDN4072744.1 IscS subfamily cysteine desulfurase [Fictibacillus sp. CENA-BCM004]
MIYLDYAATTPMSEEALFAFTETARMYYGNPSSLHDDGTQAAELVNLARAELAHMIGGRCEGLYFTSGGSDGNFFALTSLALGNRERGNHIITSPLEHGSVQQALSFLEEDGFEITVLPIDPNGRINVDDLQRAIRKETILVTIAHGNSEIGVIQPLSEIGALLKEKNIIFHSDCVQTFGKIPLHAGEMNIGALTISAHKIHGPKGVGAVYISPDFSWKPLLSNGTHERGFRPGTVNTPGIVSFITAASNQVNHMVEWNTNVQELRNYFLSLTDEDEHLIVEGHSRTTLPHFLAIRLKGIEGQYVMLELNRYKIAVSTGSACKAGQQEPSKALLAMGRSADEAHELVRITLGKETTKAEIQALTKAIHVLTKRYYDQTGS